MANCLHVQLLTNLLSPQKKKRERKRERERNGITTFQHLAIDSGKKSFFAKRGSALLFDERKMKEERLKRERERGIKRTDEERFVIKGSHSKANEKSVESCCCSIRKPLEKAPYTGACACAREQSVTSIKGTFTRPVLSLSLSLSTFVCHLKRFQQVLPHRQIACKPFPAQLRADRKGREFARGRSNNTRPSRSIDQAIRARIRIQFASC